MPKLDLKKTLGHLYAPPVDRVVRVEVPTLQYLMLDGHGDPTTAPEYAEAVEALFSVAYALKFAIKRGPSAIDYGVMPLEGLWWADDMSSFSVARKSDWKWTLMILQPDLVDAELLERTQVELARKKRVTAIERIRLESLSEAV